MNLKQLSVFQKVCATGNMTKASEELYMTQPAVSHVISTLETELGYPLFDRISRKIYLNDAGSLFLSKTNKLLESYEDLKQSAKDMGACSALRIGSSITIANFILPKIIKQFTQCNLPVSLKVIIENAAEIEQKLMRNEIDIALIEGVIYHPQLIKIPFSYHELYVICSSAHPFAHMKNISLQTLEDWPLLMREKGSAIRSAFDSALLVKNVSLEPDWVSVNSQALIQAVIQNLGITILPEILVKEEIKKGLLCAKRIEGIQLNTINHIVYHKDKYQTKAFQIFLETAKQYTEKDFMKEEHIVPLSR